MIRLISRLATWRGITCLLVLYAIVFGAILISLNQLTTITGGYGILDFDRGYSASRVAEVFGSYGDEGFRLYGRIQALDLLNPALYSLITAIVTYLLWRGRGRDWLCLMPLLGGLGDYAENITLFWMTRSHPDIPDTLVSVSSFLNLLKTGLLFVGLSPLIAGLVAWAFRRMGRNAGPR